MKAGALVSDEIVIGIVQEKLTDLIRENKGFILDGFPRTIPQAEALNSFLDDKGAPITHCVYLEVPFEILEERICGRWIHKPSGRSYHTKFAPPKVPGKDDVTGEDLIQRKDDTAEALKTRLAAYESQTMPILEHYKPKTAVKICNIDANQKPEDVWKE